MYIKITRFLFTKISVLSTHLFFVFFAPPLILFSQRMSQQLHLQEVEIKNTLIVSLLSYLFCAESDKVGSLGSKWNLAPQLELTVLAVDLKKEDVDSIL